MQEEKEGRLVSIRVSCLLNAEKQPERDGVILTVEAFLFVLDTRTGSRAIARSLLHDFETVTAL